MKILTKKLASFAGILLLTAPAFAQNGTWTNALGGNWSDTNNWLNGIRANGPGSIAGFTTIDIPSNTTITVIADLDPVTSGPFTNGIMRFGDADISTNSPFGSWIIAEGGTGLTLDSATTSNAIIHVDLAKGAANNLVAGWGTATIQAGLTGTNTLVKSGPNHLILNPAAGNSYSGGTILSNGMLQVGVASQTGTANTATLGTGPVIFRGGSLRLQNAAIPGNNPGNGGGGVPGLTLPLIIEPQQYGTLYLPPRSFPAFNSTVHGGGTLRLVVDFVRDNLGGDWTDFTGRVEIASSTRQNGDLRLANTFLAEGWANNAVTFTNNGVNANTVFMYNSGPVGRIVHIGEMEASLAGIVNVISANTTQNEGGGNSGPVVYQVGALNTDASFSGNFPAGAGSVGLIKVGTGNWTLNGPTVEYTGTTVISNGVMQFGSGISGKIGRSAVVSNYSAIAFGRTDAGLVVTNIIDGSGVIIQRGSGRTTLSPEGGANTYTGRTFITNGTLAVAGEAALGAAPASLVADQLTLNGGSLAVTTSLSIDDANRGVTLGANGGRLGADGTNTLTVANVIGGAGNLTIDNTGAVAPTAANNYTGKTIVQSGTLLLAAETAMGIAPGLAIADQLTLNGGTVRSSGTFAIDDANRGVTIGASGGTFAPDAGTTLTLSQPIVGPGNLTKSGAGILIINGADSRSGGTVVGEGTLAFGASAVVSSPLISVPAGSTLDVTALAGGLTLGAGQTLAGNGTVLGNVTVNTGGALSAGASVGALNITGNLALNGGSDNVEIASTTNDIIIVTGDLSLTGVSTINLTLLSSLPVGTYQLIKYGGTLTSGGVANLALIGYPVSRVTGQLVHNAGTKSIDLVVSGAAGNLVWKGGLNGNAWDVAITTNWLNGVIDDAFLNGDAVTFDNTGAANATANLVGALVPGSVTVNSTTDYTFGGAGRLSSLATLTKSGANKLTVLATNDNIGATVINGGILQVGNGTASGSLGSGDITDNGTLLYNVPGSVTVPGQITGTGGVAVNAGTVVLTGNNSYGATTVGSGATLQVGNGGATGSLGNGSVANSGAVIFNRTGAVSNNGAISGSGSLSVQGSGTVVLAANNSYAGATTVNAGVLQVGAGGSVGSLGSASEVTLANGGTLAFDRADNLTNAVAVIGTNGTLRQAGGGTLVITNDANDYGATHITNGKLQLGDGVNLSGKLGRGTVTVSAPGSLVLNHPDVYTLTNLVTGNGSVAHVGPTNLIVTTLQGANTYSGGTTISNSTVQFVAPVTAPVLNGVQQVNGSGLGSGTVTFLGSSTLEFHWANQTDPDGGGAGNFAAPINVPAGQTASLWLPGRFELSSAVGGAGTVNLGVNYVRGNISGSWSNFTGQLNVVTNILNPNDVANDFRVFNAAGFPGARMHLLDGVAMFWRGAANSIVPIGQLTGDPTAFIGGTGGAEGGNAVTWRVGGLNTDATYDGTSGGSVAVGFIKEGSGRWTLTGANNHLGNTTISNGILSVADAGSIGASVNIIVASPGLLVATNAVDGAFHLGGVSASALGGNSALVGDLVIEGFGMVSPGFPIGNFTVTGQVTNRGMLFMELNRDALPNCDRLTSTGLTNESGSLTVTNSGDALRSGDSFQLIVTTPTPNNITGDFGSVTLPPLAPGLSWVDTTATDGRLTVVGGLPTLTNSISGNTISFSWDTAFLGWRLQVQTNAINVGISTNWVDVPGTEATTSATSNVDPANPSVFYRLAF